jgi:hypothetical protein
MGDLYDRVQEDVRTYLNGEFSNPIVLIKPDATEIELNGFTTIHSQGFDENGIPVISETAHLTISERDLIAAGETVRNANGNINLVNWKVRFTHATQEVTMVLSEPEPDSTLGIIRVKLTKYGTN